MSNKRKQYNPQFKAKVALEAIRGNLMSLNFLLDRTNQEFLQIVRILCDCLSLGEEFWGVIVVIYVGEFASVYHRIFSCNIW